MALADLSLVRQLGANSQAYRDPLTQLDWASLNLDDYWLPLSAISLHGTPAFAQAPEIQRKRLSQYEFLAFAQAGLWLEGIFLERLARQLHTPGEAATHAYFLHEIREEAGHSLMFLRLMEHSGLHLPQGLCTRPRLAHLLGRFAPMGGALFWLAVILGEEIPDKLNRHVRMAGIHTVNPLIRDLCSLHVMDEARHIAHARSALASGLQHGGMLKKTILARVAALLLKQFIRSFYLPEAGIYELAGFSPGTKWRALARQNPVRQAFVQRCAEPSLNLLRSHGIQLDLPSF